jgi:hypothetical protein
LKAMIAARNGASDAERSARAAIGTNQHT